MPVGPVTVNDAQIGKDGGDCFRIIKIRQPPGKTVPCVKCPDRIIIPDLDRVVIHGMFFSDIICLTAEHDTESGFAHESKARGIVICGICRD